jgi:hypothetical protein
VTHAAIDDVVKTISEMTSRDEVMSYLESPDVDLRVADLRAVARALGPTVCATGTKAALRRNIAEGTAGFRQASTAVLGGAWPSLGFTGQESTKDKRADAIEVGLDAGL